MIYEPAPAGSQPPDLDDALTACIESGASALLLDEHAIAPEFFDLSTLVAGNPVQRLRNYGIRMAAVVPTAGGRSVAFQDFVREANTGSGFRFFSSREDAMRWLESAS